MRIEIEEPLCQASGTCVRLAPAIFEIAEHGEFACVRPEGAALLEAGGAEAVELVTEAEQSCPTGAITVTD